MIPGYISKTNNLSGRISAPTSLKGNISADPSLKGSVSVSVRDVPYYETSNSSGGSTVYIGKEV